jgi:DNA-binding transcriptional regulator LsrR (DeoR family)
MSQWAEIRHLCLVEGVARREVARRLGVGRKTVARALAQAREAFWPSVQRSMPASSSSRRRRPAGCASTQRLPSPSTAR